MYTQADADKVREAILKLAGGEQVVRVRYDGPPAREVQYGAAKLDELKKLLAEIEASLNPTATIGAGGSVWVKTVYDKGFCR